MRLPKDYREFLQSLNAHCVDYVIVGAFAMGYYQCPRYTGDIDILVGTNPENASRLLRALDDFGFSSLNLSEEDFTKGERIMQLGVEPLRIDLLTSIDGVSLEEVFANRKVEKDEDITLPFIGLSELIKNKKASARPKDIADLVELQRERPEQS